MQEKKQIELEMAFGGYADLMLHFSEDQKILDLCAMLHSCELELLSQMSDLSLTREINLIWNNLIIKIFVKSDELNKNMIYLRNKKNAMSFELRKLRSIVGLYDSNEERIHYYILMPIDDFATH